MTEFAARRAAQLAVMADPDRLRILTLALAAPTGEVSASSLAGPAGDPQVFTPHLEAMTAAGLLIRDGNWYRPSHDALVRFGSLTGDVSGVEDQEDMTPDHSSGPRVADALSGFDAPSDYGDHERLLRVIESELIDAHIGVLAPETIRRFVQESYDLLAARARVRRYLPQLTARFAADRLAAVATLTQTGAPASTDVLFVCVHNSGRSQIAAALMRARAGSQIRIRAAGSAPRSRLDPAVRAELARLGVDGFAEFPRPLTDEVVRASGVVVTLGCGDACPVVPGRRYVDWPVADPTGASVREVRRIVADIGARVNRLLAQLGVERETQHPRSLS